MGYVQVVPLQGDSGKFSEVQLNLKRNMRKARQVQGYTVEGFAKALGVTRKKYEDMETLRDYGCYVSWDAACKCSDILGIPLEELRTANI